MPTSQARVVTDAAPRYAKQLASHFGHKIEVEATPDGYRLNFQGFEAVLTPRPDHLLLRASAPDQEALAAAQQVVGGHLERFGARNELSVQWEEPSMKAVVVTGFGTQPHLADVDRPQPGPGEILVRLHAAGLNPFDWKVVDGALKDFVPHNFPLVLGSDGAGVVEEVGAGVTLFKPGDRVYGQFMRVEHGHGSYAEYTIAAEDGKVSHIPDGLPFPLAAALPTASVTAYQAIQAAQLNAGQTILVNGATGGVGQSAVQFAAQAGAAVVATTTPELAGHLRDLGASHVVDFTAQPVTAQVAAAHPEGVDAILDLVSVPGGDIDGLAALLRPGGVLLSTNHAAGALARQDIRGVNVTNHATTADLTAIAELAAAGGLRVNLEIEVPLADAPAAIARAKNGHAARGKTVVSIA